MLQLSSLTVSVGDKQVLGPLDLHIAAGSRVALMGPNGSGKSSLAAALTGHPDYSVAGSALWNGQELLELSPEARAAAGLFLSFQTPPSVPGVPVNQLIRLARHAQEASRGVPRTEIGALIRELRTHCQTLDLPVSFLERGSGEGMSGGEKKRFELLQLLALSPSLVILDEVDSGLDVDGLKAAAQALAALPSSTTVIIITHYKRLLELVPVDQVYVLRDGALVTQGDSSLIDQIEERGYANL